MMVEHLRERWPKILERLHKCPDTGCWNWTGWNDGKGYGKVSIRGVVFYVHRVAYIVKHGKIPNGNEVDHICCNRSCCNPEHLQPATRKRNMRLMHKRRKNV